MNLIHSILIVLLNSDFTERISLISNSIKEKLYQSKIHFCSDLFFLSKTDFILDLDINYRNIYYIYSE